MRTAVFSLLLLFNTGIMFAQSSDTQSFTVNVTAASSSTGNLLTGKTPATLTTLPPGWSLACKQNWDSSTLGSNGATCISGDGLISTSSSMVVTADYAHGSGRSLRTNPAYGVATGTNGMEIFRLPNNGHNEVYLSWWERFDPFTNGVGWYHSGTDQYRVNFVPIGGGGPQMTFNGGFGGCPGGVCDRFGYNHFSNYWQPQGVTGAATYTFNDTSAGYDGLWYQYELHYKPNTSTGGVANTDGIIQVWRNGQNLGSKVNANINGLANMADYSIQLSGHYSNIMWLTNATSQSQCNALMDAGGPFSCGTHPANGYGCDVSSRSWSYAQINAACQGQAPSSTWYKYIDDVILLYK